MMGQHAKDALDAAMDYWELRTAYRLGRVGFDVAHEHGVIDDLGYDLDVHYMDIGVEQEMERHNDRAAKAEAIWRKMREDNDG